MKGKTIFCVLGLIILAGFVSAQDVNGDLRFIPEKLDYCPPEQCPEPVPAPEFVSIVAPALILIAAPGASYLLRSKE
ncbi:hypothetical protein ACFLRC_04140 [Candidatus Altiarchaeota archaeon]